MSCQISDLQDSKIAGLSLSLFDFHSVCLCVLQGSCKGTKQSFKETKKKFQEKIGFENKKKQAGAELCQAQTSLG